MSKYNFILKVLDAIKSNCETKNDNCDNCPFNLSGAWHDYCMFMGMNSHEGRTPEDWELNEIKWGD